MKVAARPLHIPESPRYQAAQPLRPAGRVGVAHVPFPAHQN
jgi:hypothetical protein